MKLTDWCLLFVTLFVCSQLPKYLEDKMLQQGTFTTVEYNRIMDQAALDCLMGTVKEEFADGSVRIDTKEAETHFYDQIAFVCDATDEVSRNALWSGVKMKQFINRNESAGIWNGYRREEGITMQESEQLRNLMENQINQAKRKDAALFTLSFPFITGEDWYQNLKPRAFYIMYEGKEVSWKKDNNRFLFSGSMIRKTDED